MHHGLDYFALVVYVRDVNFAACVSLAVHRAQTLPTPMITQNVFVCQNCCDSSFGSGRDTKHLEIMF
jgi:hypothetical protein